eukprot:3767125-Ditylum_brightwellii.AAC.1
MVVGVSPLYFYPQPHGAGQADMSCTLTGLLFVNMGAPQNKESKSLTRLFQRLASSQEDVAFDCVKVLLCSLAMEGVDM